MHYIKASNAFCLWLHEDGHLAERLQLPLLKVEQRIIQTLSDQAMQVLLRQKPKRFDQWRLHALVCLLYEQVGRSVYYAELMAQRQDLELQGDPIAERRAQGYEQRNDDGSHRRRRYPLKPARSTFSRRTEFLVGTQVA